MPIPGSDKSPWKMGKAFVTDVSSDGQGIRKGYACICSGAAMEGQKGREQLCYTLHPPLSAAGLRGRVGDRGSGGVEGWGVGRWWWEKQRGRPASDQGRPSSSFSQRREHTSQQAWEVVARESQAVQMIISIYTRTSNALNSSGNVIQI